MKYDIIIENLQTKYNHLVKLGYEVVGVFLYGSQNYHIDTENSDIDARAIVIPSIKDIINNKTKISKTIVMDNGEHIEVKDINSMHECFLKQSKPFVEILFTPFKILNPIYSHLYNAVLSKAETIARYNEVLSVKNMTYMLKSRIDRMTHARPGNQEFIEKYGYDYKELVNIIQEYNLIDAYIKGYDYKSCLIPKDRIFILSIKENPAQFAPQEALNLANYLVDKAYSMYENYANTNKEYKHSSIEKILDDAKEKIMISYLKKEIKKY